MQNWKDIVEACRRGESRAERRLFDGYGDRCFQRAYRYVENRAEAADVVSQAFMKAFRGLDKTDFPDQNRFESWLLRIVANEALMLLRKRKKTTTVDLTIVDRQTATEGSSATEELERDELVAQINDLPGGYRKVMRLFAIHGYSHAEIGARLMISEGTSRSQLSKARKMLKKRLKLRGYE